MTRRQFGMVGLSSVGAGVLGGVVVGQERRSRRREEPQGEAHRSEATKACAQACSDCQRECDACATYCGHLLSENKKDHMATMMTCQDCADFCVAAAQIIARMGPFAALVCRACAEACARCSKECEKHSNDERMKRCADECRKCEKACNDMIKHADTPA